MSKPKTSLTLVTTLIVALLLLAAVAWGDASVDLGNGKTRFDEARAWCVEKNDPSLNFLIVKDTRVVFQTNCAKFLPGYTPFEVSLGDTGKGIDTARVWCETEGGPEDSVVFEYKGDPESDSATIILSCTNIIRHFEENHQ